MNTTTLQSELDAFRMGWESRVGETIARMIAGDIDDLRATGILDRSAGEGDAFRDPGTLLDAKGRAFDLAGLVARQPTIVVFYRGGWCPYCNLELREYQKQLAAIHAAGAELVAVSPEQPDHALSTAEKNDLSFTVLSDVGGALASQLGIRFTLSDAVRPFYEKAGHALPERNGDGSWALPMPATFVVERGGRIAKAFIKPDYRKRLEPLDALAVLGSLTAAPAA
jgi:peroxiredoxin